MNPNSIPKRLSCWMLGCLASVLATASVQGQTSIVNSASITVRDNNTATPYPSRITVGGIVGAVQKATVTISGVTHGYPDDMDIVLVAPSGDRIVLMSDAGGQFDLNTAEITFDSAAANAVPDEAPIATGTYKPFDYAPTGEVLPSPFPTTGSLGADLGVLVGDTANGNWDLYIVDDQEIDAGTIRSWTLTLTTRPIITIRAEDQAIETDEDESITIPVRVVDSDTPAGNLTLGTANRNNDLFTVTFGGSGTNRTATIIPRQNAHGSDTFNITVTDGSGFTESSPDITLTIDPVNDAPTLALGASTVTIPQGGISGPIAAIVRDIDLADDDDRTQIRLGAFSDNESVVASSNVFFTISGTTTPGTNSFRIVPTGAATGSANVTIFAIDPEGETNEIAQVIAVNVTPIPQPVFGNPTTINLPDGDGGPEEGSPYPSVVNASGVSGLVGRVDLSLIDVEHTNPEDIGALLVTPDGRRLVLMRSAGGATDVNDIRLTFSTLADPADNIPNDGPLTTSTNRTEDHGNGDFLAPAPAGFPYPDEIESLEGATANGRWELYVYDTTDNGASGLIRGGWVMTIYPAPTIANIPTQSLQEGSTGSAPGVVPVVPADVNTIDVNINVADMDGAVTNLVAFVSGATGTGTTQPSTNTPTQIIDVVTVPANGTVTGNNAIVRVSTRGDQHGTNEVTVIAMDNTGKFLATNRFNVIVIPINDAPTQTVISKQVTSAGEPILLIPFTIGDLETDPEDLEVTVSTDNTKLLPAGSIVLTNIDESQKAISIFPAGTVAGQAFITVRVENGNGSVTSQTFDLTVTQPASPLYEQTAQVSISDNAITSSTIGVSNLVSTIAEVQVTLYGINHPNPDDIDVMLVSPDGTALTLMSDVGDDLAAENVILVFKNDARDSLPDNGQLYSFEYLPTDIGGTDDDFTGTTVPEENASGLPDFIGEDPNGTWTLYVRDDTDSERGGSITAWQLNIRTIPQLGAIQNQETAEDTPISFRVTLGDFQPGVPLDFVLAHVSGPDLVGSRTVTRSETDNTATITITPEQNQFGTEVLTLRVTDEDGNTDSETFSFIVNSRNDPPTISDIPSPQTTPAATPITITFNVSDAPNESTPGQIVTTWSSDNQTLVPNGNISIETDSGNPAIRRITILPAGLSTGSATITVTARDNSGSGLTDTESFVLNVTPSVGGINPARIAIPSFGAGSPYPSIIDLTGAGIQGRVSNARVILDGLSHIFPDDVDVLLVGPDDTAVLLMADAGGDENADNARLTFSATGGVLPDETELVSGTYRPNNYADTFGGNDIFPSAPAGSPNPPAPPTSGVYSTLLTDFDGINPNGQWRLYVRDDTTDQSGEILRGWILILETGPTISELANQTFPEDTTPIRIPFTVFDEDSDADELDVSVAIDDSGDFAEDLIADVDIDADGFNYTLLLQPSTNRPVSLTTPETNLVTITVTDERGVSEDEEFLIIITPVDDPPTIARSASSVTINEDGSTSFQITIRDVDSVLRTNELQIASSNSELVPVKAPNITVDSPTGRDIPRDTAGVLTINVTPVANQNGFTDLTFTIRDKNGGAGAGSASTTVRVNVNPVNDNPFIGPLHEDDQVSMEAGSTIIIPFVVTDNETRSTDIEVTATSSNDAVIPDANVVVGGSGTNRNITINALNLEGQTQITITARDDNEPVAGVTTRLLTVDVDPSPTSVFANLTPIVIRETNTANPFPSSITINSGELVGRIHTISVVVDGLTHDIPDDVDIMLVAPNNEKVMLMSDAGNANSVNGVRLTFTDGATVLPDEGTITSGTYRPANYRGSEGETDAFPAPVPSGTVNTTLGTFVGDSPIGTWSLYVMDDGVNGEQGAIQFGWSLVIETRPVIDLDEATLSNGTFEQWNEDQTGEIEFTIDDQVTDPDNLDILVTSARPEVLPAENVRLDRSAGDRIVATLRSAPNASSSSPFNLTFTVVRGRGTPDEASSSITVPVNVLPVADLPTIGAVGNVSTPEDTSISININVNDPDSARSALRLVAVSDDQAVVPNARISIAGGDNDVTGLPANPVRITILPATNAVGDAEITLTAFDESGGSSPVELFTVTVTAVNDAPILALDPPTSIEAGTTLVTPFTITDAEGQTVIMTATSTDTNLVRNEDIVITPASGTQSARTLAITARSNVVGTTRIVLAYGDGTATNTFQFNLNVRLPRERNFSNNTPITIRDNNSATPYPSEIAISNFVGNISEINVTLNGFEHQFPGDVDILLVSPRGQKVMLMSDAGAGSPVAGLNIEFDQDAAAPVPQNSPLSSGSFQPADYDATPDTFPAPAPSAPYEDSLDVFNGFSPNGTWSLYIVDDFQGQDGRITNGWTLSVTTEPIVTLATNVLNTTEDREVSTTFTIQEESFGGQNFTFDFASTNELLIPPDDEHIIVANRGGGTYTLTIIPEENRSGTSLVTLFVTNEDGQTVEVEFRVNVEDINDAPVITGTIPDVTLVAGEATTIDDEITISDPETARNDLTVTVTSTDPAVMPPSNVTVNGNDVTVTTFGSTATGTSRVTITVRDPQGLTASTSFVVTVVRPVTPIFTSSGAITVPPSGVANPYPSVINVSGLQGTVTRVTATLVGVTHSFPDDLDILLVGPNNQSIMLMSDAGGPDDLNNVRLTFADGSPGLPEATQITSGTYSPSNYEANIDNFPPPGPGNIPLGSFPLSAFNGSNPNGSWSLYVLDDGTPDGGSIAGWMISIQTTAPTISDILDLTINEDTPVSIPFRVEDGDTEGDDIIVSVATDASPVVSVAWTTNDNDRVLTIVPLSNASGTDTITVTARDGTFTTTEVFTVTVAPVNDAPIISGLTDASTPANRPLVSEFNVFDVENDPLTVGATIADPSFGSVAVTGTGFTRTLTFTPSGVQGNVSVSVTASDGSTITTNTILITVVAPPGPEITEFPDLTIPEGATTNIVFDVSIPEVDPTNLVVTADIQGAPIISVATSGTGEERTLTINALGNLTGTNVVTLTLSDASGSTTNIASTTFDVVVVNVDNDTPVLQPIANQRTQPDTSLVIPLVVSDPDTTLEQLTFFAATQGDNVIQDIRFELTSSNTVNATIIPVPGATGTALVRVSVSDGTSVAQQTFSFTVDTPNAAPVIGPIADVQTPEDVGVTVVVNVTDAETPVNQLTITGAASNTNLVSAVTVANNGGVVQATINLVTNASGSSVITISATDGTNITERAFNLTVIPVPECPVLGVIGNQTVAVGATSLTLTLNVTDPDTDLNDLTFLSATAGTSVVENVTFNVSPNGVTAVIGIRAGASGTDRVRVSVSDGVCTVDQIFEVSVGDEPGDPATVAISRSGTDFVLTVTGTPGATYVIEATANFQTWTDVGAVTIPAAGGSAQFTVPLNTRFVFFRARSAGSEVQPQAAVYEGFGYPAGTTISTNENGGTGWTTPWTPDADTPTNHIVLDRNMEYGDGTGKSLVTTAGSVFYTATTNNMASGDVRSFREFAPRTNGTSWISFISQRMGPTITNTGTPNNIYPRAANLSFYEGGTERFAIGNGSGAVSNLWSVLPAGSVNNVTNAQRSAVPMNQQAFIVLRVDHIDGANDNLYMWINPPLGTEPDPATASARSEGAFNFSFDRIRPFVGGADTGNNRPYAELALDEIRVGDSFAAVTPFESDVTNPINAVVLVNGTNDDDTNAGAPPAAEGVTRVIDNAGQKYLNFLDLNSGFIVSPAGQTVVTGLRFWTANDAADRDPASYRLEGSNDGTTFTLISEGPLNLPLARNAGGAALLVGGNVQIVHFPNTTPYSSYRVVFPTLRNASAANSMQIAEVDFIGTF